MVLLSSNPPLENPACTSGVPRRAPPTAIAHTPRWHCRAKPCTTFQTLIVFNTFPPLGKSAADRHTGGSGQTTRTDTSHTHLAGKAIPPGGRQATETRLLGGGVSGVIGTGTADGVPGMHPSKSRRQALCRTLRAPARPCRYHRAFCAAGASTRTQYGGNRLPDPAHLQNRTTPVC